MRKIVLSAFVAALLSGTAFAAPAVYEARGQEPGWLLRLDTTTASLSMAGAESFTDRLPQPGRIRGGRSYAVTFDGKPVRILIENRLCRDAMSGMPHPDRVTIKAQAATLRGCGGSPRALLGEDEWAITEIAGKRVIARSKPSIRFFDESSVAGNGSCNRFRAGYALSGEGLTIKQPASTMMACDPALMKQEHTLLKQLEATTAFDIRRDGALVLTAADGSRLVAKRAR